MLIVDGNNVMGTTPDGWWRDRPAAVRRLLARLQCYAGSSGLRIVLVLDVPQPDLPVGDHAGVEVRYPSRGGRNAADEHIVALVPDLGPAPVEVVTSDRALATEVLGLGAPVIGAREFLIRLEQAGC